MTAPPAPAPDDLMPDCYFFDCDHSIPAAQHELSRNCPICLHAEIGELTAALAARDAEIAAERKRADILWQECENLRVAIEDLRLEWRHQFSVRNEYQDMSELERIADAALAAERTQGTP